MLVPDTPRRSRTKFGVGLRWLDDGAECLVLSVQPRANRWRITSGAFGVPDTTRDAAFVAGLRRKTGHRDIWWPVHRDAAEQDLVLHAIDLGTSSGSTSKVMPPRLRQAAVEFQLKARVLKPGAEYLHMGVELRPYAGQLHVVGCAIRRQPVDDEYRFCRRALRLRRPHMAAAALGLANTCLALHPAVRTKPARHLLCVVEALHAFYGCYCHGPLFMESLYHLPAARERLRPEIIDQWCGYLREQYALGDTAVDVCVLQSWPLEHQPAGLPAGCIWNPWQSDALEWVDPQARALVNEHLDLAPFAFGLALQGA